MVANSPSPDQEDAQVNPITIECSLEIVLPPLSDSFIDLVNWWRLLPRREGVKLFAMFLTLPADGDLTQYLVENLKELKVISGDQTSIIFLSKTRMPFPILKELPGLGEWVQIVGDHTLDGDVCRLSQRLSIELEEFPSLLLFTDLRDPKFALVSLKDMTTKKLVKRVRSIFSVIGKALKKDEDPLVALKNLSRRDNFVRKTKFGIDLILKVFNETAAAVTKGVVEGIAPQ